MNSRRIEGFSDAVLAIIITIMVLELNIPEGNKFTDLQIPLILMYTFSFGVIAVLWNTHHHLLSLVNQVNAKIMWMNNILLFSISLIPFATEWLGENNFSGDTVAFYGIILIFISFTFGVLQAEIFKQRNHKLLRLEVLKSTFSLMFFLLGIAMSWLVPYLSIVFYLGGLFPWLTPSKIIDWIVKGESREHKIYKKIKKHEEKRKSRKQDK